LRYHDVLSDNEGRFNICKTMHRTQEQAMKCGSRKRRQLQLGTSHLVLTSIRREFRKPPGGAVERGRIEGLPDHAWQIY
jgi:hypothetical protein